MWVFLGRERGVDETVPYSGPAIVAPRRLDTLLLLSIPVYVVVFHAPKDEAPSPPPARTWVSSRSKASRVMGLEAVAEGIVNPR